MSPLSVGELGRFVADHLDVGVFAIDSEFRVTLWNRFMATHSRQRAEAVVGRNLFDCFPELPRGWLERKVRQVQALRNHAFTSWTQRPYLFRFDHNRPITGGVDAMRQNCTFMPVKGEDGCVSQVCVTVQDVTDTAIAHEALAGSLVELEREKVEQQRLIGELEEAHMQVLQSEKLASIGQLAAGVAHEINNPIGYVSANLGSLKRYLDDLMKVVDAHLEVAAELPVESREKVAARTAGIDVAYLRADLPELLGESCEGLERVRRIVLDLKDFSRMGETEKVSANLHRCLDSTLNMVANELRYKADLEKCYGELPEIQCVPSQLNQVFMNLLMNAAQAIEEHGRITVTTGRVGDEVFVSVRDSGCGIPPDELHRLFDPFFTTKPVGSGTGLGLSISYGIVERHNGRIEVDSTPGQGSEFKVWLPLQRVGGD